MKYSYLFALLVTIYCTYAQDHQPPMQTNQDAYTTLQGQSLEESSRDTLTSENQNFVPSLEDVQKFEEKFDAFIENVQQTINAMHSDPRKKSLRPSLSKNIVTAYLSECLKNNPEKSKNINLCRNVKLQSGIMTIFREGSTIIIDTLISSDYEEINHPKENALQEEKNLLKYKILQARKKYNDPNSDLPIKLDKNTKSYLRIIGNRPTIECLTFVSKKQFKMVWEEIKERKNSISTPESENANHDPETENTGNDGDDKYNAIYE
jgi:hypothetical protein